MSLPRPWPRQCAEYGFGGLTRRSGDRLARLDHGGVSRAGVVGAARGKPDRSFRYTQGQRNAENASCSVSYTLIKLLKPLVLRTSFTGPLALQIFSSPRFPCNNLAPRRITRRPALLTYSSSARLSRTRLCSPFAMFTMRSPASPDEVLSRLPLMSTTSTSWILRVSIFIGAS